MKEIAGLCNCGREMEHRIISEDNVHMVYGICKKCETVLVQYLSTEYEPIQDVDYTINYKIKAEKGTPHDENEKSN